MKKRYLFNSYIKILFTAISLPALLSFLLPEEKKITVYLIGDSTMCFYDKRRFPQEGWGMPFAYFFDSLVVIDNRARGGRSSKSFQDENLWQPVVDKLQPGDYVLIQFGHNDAANSKDHPTRYASPQDYKKYMGKYITETRSKNAIPVLITPVAKRSFDSTGKVREVHAPYRQAVLELGETYKVPVIDLDEKSKAMIEKLGPEFSKYVYLFFEPGEMPVYPNGIQDNTHFSEFGARKMAQLVIEGIKEQHIGLADHIKKVIPKN